MGKAEKLTSELLAMFCSLNLVVARQMFILLFFFTTYTYVKMLFGVYLIFNNNFNVIIQYYWITIFNTLETPGRRVTCRQSSHTLSIPAGRLAIKQRYALLTVIPGRPVTHSYSQGGGLVPGSGNASWRNWHLSPEGWGDFSAKKDTSRERSYLKAQR